MEGVGASHRMEIGLTAVDEGGKGVEVLHWARDGCADGEELGARGGEGDGGEGVGYLTGQERRGQDGVKRSNERSV